ncbi:MAG: hypothetical protein AUI14_02440 [Actinobacteria bacterium 13_2_20CM_2_71_6]|nr:MAG: hypothetical protein AUI14_02440 [Actinobacteria bacterium 13_2_20CM_2_71_6]
MATARDRVLTTVDTLSEFSQRSRATLADRWRRARAGLLFAAQAGLAAGLSWLVANDLLHHARPFFAPIAAVIALNVSVGQRLRRVVELVVGVALGILVGDVLIYFVGTGPAQIGLGVGLAILVAVFLGGSPIVIGQAAASAVLVATLAPPSGGIYYARFVDALIGGVIGILVMALLLPVNPLTVIRRAAGPALDVIAEGLRDCAIALSDGSRDEAEAALTRLRAGEAKVVAFREALAGAREAATLAPVFWRSRGPLAQYLDAAEHIDHALRNGRVLARRTVALLRDGEPVPPGLVEALGQLADAVDLFRDELAAGTEPERCRELTLSAVRAAADVYRTGLGFSGGVVVAQIRTIATDLLLASGLPRPVVEKAIRRAVGRVPSR